MDLTSEAGLVQLNNFLADRSYVEGHVPSKADAVCFAALKGASPDAGKFPHAARWFSHIQSFGETTINGWKGEAKEISAYIPVAAVAAKAAAAADDDDVDLFGSDEEEDEEAERAKAQRLAEYQAKKAKKPVVIAKSMMTLEVKPWDDETDLKAMEAGVRAISLDGLVWGTSKFVPIGYGINKLQINCVVEDDKVGFDDLNDQISALEDYVQSVDMQSMSKI